MINVHTLVTRHLPRKYAVGLTDYMFYAKETHKLTDLYRRTVGVWLDDCSVLLWP